MQKTEGAAWGDLVFKIMDMFQAGMLRSRTQTVDVAETLAACVDRVAPQYPEVNARITVAPAAAIAPRPGNWKTPARFLTAAILKWFLREYATST